MITIKKDENGYYFTNSIPCDCQGEHHFRRCVTDYMTAEEAGKVSHIFARLKIEIVKEFEE